MGTDKGVFSFKWKMPKFSLEFEEKIYLGSRKEKTFFGEIYANLMWLYCAKGKIEFPNNGVPLSNDLGNLRYICDKIGVDFEKIKTLKWQSFAKRYAGPRILYIVWHLNFVLLPLPTIRKKKNFIK